MGWVNTVVQTAASLGIERQQLLAKAAIPMAALQWERWPIDHMTRLWRAAETCSGDRGFGLKVGEQVGLGSINLVGFALQSAASLREAIGMVQRYQRLISDGGRFQLLAGEAASWLIYHPRQGELAFSPHQLEAVLAAVVSLSGRLLEERVAARRVQLNQSQLGPSQGYRHAFGCPVDFEQAFSGMQIDNALLDRPLPQADVQFARLHQQQLASRMASLSEAEGVAAHLKQWLSKQLPIGLPRRARAAAILGISERTLARQLMQEGTTYSELFDQVRRQAALKAVQEGRQPLSEIAQQLGFAEPSTFYRAFCRWTGRPPGRWRRQHQS